MKTVNIHEAKTHFSRLVDEAAAGGEIVVSRAGRPAARLVPLSNPSIPRRFGVLKGKVRIRADFMAPLPDDIVDLFER